jgi:hypothetical protein
LWVNFGAKGSEIELFCGGFSRIIKDLIKLIAL